MIDIDQTYFEWLLKQLNPEGVREGVAHVCNLLYNCEFLRRIELDRNRAVDGITLREEFFDVYDEMDFEEEVVDEFMGRECNWLEMMVALARRLDFLYEGGVEGRFLEMINNMQLSPLMEFNPHRSLSTFEFDQAYVDGVTDDINNNRISRDGRGGLFPLSHTPPYDQRESEIWAQQGAYFIEKMREGVLWTSIS